MSYAVYRQLSGPTGIDHAVKVALAEPIYRE